LTGAISVHEDGDHVLQGVPRLRTDAGGGYQCGAESLSEV
jgi:hypothetical protein